MVSGVLNNFVLSVEKTGGSNALFELVEKSYELMTRNVGSLDAVYDMFDIETYGIVHAAILKAKYSMPSQIDKEAIITQTVSFFKRCPEETIKKAQIYVRFISREFTVRLIAWDTAIRGIVPLKECIKKLQSTPEQLTAIHGDICQLSLSAKCFKPVIAILDNIILDVDNNKSTFEAKDYLLYFYYGGMIYCAMKLWERALHFFDLCLMICSLSTSRVMIDAAQKQILVSLIYTGKYTPGKGIQSLHLMNTPLKRFCVAYIDLANAFKTGDKANLQRVIERHRETYISDCNYGLVQQVLDGCIKARIQNLTKTFMTLSLTDFAHRVNLSGSAEAEKYLVEMIEARTIFAHIDQADKTVHFLDDPEQYDSKEMLYTVNKKMDECISLEKHMMTMSDRLLLNPIYTRRVLEMEAKSAKGFGQY